MCEEIDRQVLRKYDIESKLGKGVRLLPKLLLLPNIAAASAVIEAIQCIILCRRMVLCGRQ